MSLRLIKRGRIWHLDGTVSGIRVRESTRTDSEEIAKIIRSKREAEVHRQSIYGAERETTFAHAALAYLESGKDHRFIAPILEKWGERKIGTIKPGHVHDLAQKLYPAAGPATRNRQVLTPVSAIINFAADRGLCPPIRLRKFFTATPIRKVGNREWVDRFMWHGTCPWIGPCALFMFTTAARVGESLGLEPCNFDLRKGIGHNSRTKNGEPRIYYLTDEMVSIMRDLEPRYGRTFGFTSPNGAFRRHWKRTIEKAEIEYLTPHEAGRHSFATEAIIRNGKNIPTTAHIGNWKSHSLLSQTYAHPENQQDFVEQVFGSGGELADNLHSDDSNSVQYVDFKGKNKKRA